jgi:hypothetical protein
MGVLLSCLCSWAGWAQHPLEQPFTYAATHQPLAQVLAELEKLSGITFSYNPSRLPMDARITLRVTQEPLERIIERVCRQAHVRYEWIEKQVVLLPQKEPLHPPDKITLSGFVKDRATGEALIGATVWVPALQQGIATNGFGFYSLSLPAGSYDVVFSFLGYESQRTAMAFAQSRQANVFLAEAAPLLQQVTVEAATTGMQAPQTGSLDVRPAAIRERPALLGEMDVVKSLESVPGVKPHSDGSTFYYVRGGQRDQNLILVDDAPVYNPSHLLGFFSAIIPDAINDMTLYKGDMPAALGGRLSSVLDIRTKKGNDQHVQWWGSVGLVSNKIGVEGPFKKDKSSFLISTRFSRLRWLAQLANPEVDQFQFTDFTGKVNVEINTRNKLFFTVYNGSDNYFAENGGIQWANSAATLRWNRVWSERVFANTTLSGSSYQYSLFTDRATNTRWNSQISNLHLKTDVSYFIHPDSELQFGLGLGGYFFDPGNVRSNVSTADAPALSTRQSVETVLYGSHNLTINARWALAYGLRLTRWSNVGEAFEFVLSPSRQPVDTLRFAKGERYSSFTTAEPRLTATYTVGAQSSIKASYTHTVQNMHLISNTISPFTALEVWLPSSLNLQPQRAHQLVVGYDHRFSTLALTGEVFYKEMTNQIEYENHAETLLNPLVESELRFGKGVAYGLELMAKKETGRWRGWAGYTWSRALRQVDEINQGERFPAFFDRPHQINLMLSYDVSARWNVGANWLFLSGAPFTSPIGFYRFNGLEVPLYGQRNNDRLPDYHRMDVSATVKLNRQPEKKFQHALSFSIFNFYARKNPLFINFNKSVADDGTLKIPADLLNAQRVTSQLYLFQFTPSFTYQFKWQ